jgi:hypothetical protein
MSTKITVSYKDNDYILEFSRNTAKQIEDQGFVLDLLTEKPATMIPLLVYGAFLKNNRGIKRALVEEIYANVVGKVGGDGQEGFINVLGEMYAETVSTLMSDEPVEEGNAATWTVTRG